MLERRRGDPNTDGTRDREGEVEAAASEGIIWAAALSQPEDGGDIPQEGPTTEDMPGEVEGGGGGLVGWWGQCLTDCEASCRQRGRRTKRDGPHC